MFDVPTELPELVFVGAPLVAPTELEHSLVCRIEICAPSQLPAQVTKNRHQLEPPSPQTSRWRRRPKSHERTRHVYHADAKYIYNFTVQISSDQLASSVGLMRNINELVSQKKPLYFSLWGP